MPQASAVVTLVAVDDGEPETEEHLTLTLVSVTGAARLGDVTACGVTVAASDAPYGRVEVVVRETRSVKVY